MTPIRTWQMHVARESMINDGELCPEYIAAIVGVVNLMCVSQVSVCAKLLLTLMTHPSLAQHAVTPPVFKRHSYQIPIRTCTREHTHTSESEIMDIPLDPILSSHRGTRNAKKVTTLANIINLLTNYTRRLYMYVMTNETYVDVKSNIP